jgi:PPOX class probable F420-dependent enzyme
LKFQESVQAFLNEPRFAVLGTVNADGSPQQTVMWFELRGDHVMMNTLRGRKKDRNLLRDGRASICVEAGQRYVTIDGRVTIVDDPAVGQEDIAALARRYEGDEEGNRQSREVFGSQDRVSLLLSIDRVDIHGFDEE